jgi:ferredoxin
VAVHLGRAHHERELGRHTADRRHPLGGDAAWGPENIIWAVAHGHQAAISIDLYCNGQDLVADRPEPGTSLVSTKMGIHEWAYDNDYSEDKRYAVPHADQSKSLKDLTTEVELGFDPERAFLEAERCLNCDVQTVFARNLCIECDACVDICPVDCINFLENRDEPELREALRVPARNTEQDLYISDELPTGRIMAKDEDLCLHCGLCAERCPTGAWDMQQFTYVETQVSPACQKHNLSYVT